MSDSEDDNFCFYGKALEPYDEDAVPKKKPISVEDQIATDAHGRRRFHGAFTGGFSAGFYNTVGSLEGWKPSEFRSSRSEKAQAQQSKPEDFMDDEDIGEHGIAPQTVKATSDYASNRKRKKQIFSDGPIPGEPVLHTLISSGNETIGYLLMKNMDLKQKSKELETSNSDGSKVYGCIMPKPYEIKRNIDTSDIIPEIYTEYIKHPKSNTFGLGYEGLDKTHLNLFKSTQLVVKDKDKKLSISGQAFGVGAFENEDEDIYAKDDMSQYDFELTHEKKVQNREKKSDFILDRFILSKIPLLVAQKFAPPTIPHSFSGKHKVRKSRFEPIVEKEVKRKDMTATIRAKYIGEEVSQPEPSTSNENDKNASSSSSSSTPVKVVVKDEEVIDDKSGYNSNLLLDKFVSASEVENPHDILEAVKKTESEHGTQEMRDAAKLKMYGPLTRIISDWQPCSLLCRRFNVREPLLDDRIKKYDKKKNHIIFEYQKNNEENPSLQPGLRITKQESISTPDPTQSDNTSDLTQMKEVEMELRTDTLEAKEEAPNISAPTQMDHAISGDERKSTSLDITDKIDVSKNIDLFKAVFLSSSESEPEEEEKEKKEEEEKTRENMMKENVLNDYLIPKIKSTREGILSHITFNPLFRNKNLEPPPAEKTDATRTEGDNWNNNTAEMENEKEPNTYGPALPEKKVSAHTSTYVPNNDTNDEWIEKSDAGVRKSHKHKKKHKKEKRHKKEHKHKH